MIYTNALFVLTQWLLLLILFILILCFSFFCYFVHLQSLVMPHSFCVVSCIQIISICVKINGFIWLMVITAIHCVGSQIDFPLRSQFFQLDFCFFSCQLIILFYLSYMIQWSSFSIHFCCFIVIISLGLCTQLFFCHWASYDQFIRFDLIFFFYSFEIDNMTIDFISRITACECTLNPIVFLLLALFLFFSP